MAAADGSIHAEIVAGSMVVDDGNLVAASGDALGRRVQLLLRAGIQHNDQVGPVGQSLKLPHSHTLASGQQKLQARWDFIRNEQVHGLFGRSGRKGQRPHRAQPVAVG
ncbi:MAG: hypothetical protein QF577_04460, partial [Phycisphaerae bacterium]|nr:hypothetical protein [Phycisphaerae bacterium]